MCACGEGRDSSRYGCSLRAEAISVQAVERVNRSIARSPAAVPLLVYLVVREKS